MQASCVTWGTTSQTLEGMLREGRGTPFAPFPPGVEFNARCQIAGIYPGELTDDDVGVSKTQGRFMGRQSRLALAAARRAMAQAGLDRRDFAVVVGSGAGDVRTHVEIQEKLLESRSMRRVAADGGAPADGVHGVGQPRQRPGVHRTVVHDQRGVRGRRLQPAAGRDAHRRRALRRGRGRRVRADRSPLPRRLRLDAGLQLRGQRPSRARLASVRRGPRRVHLRGGRGHRGARGARGGRGPRRRHSRHAARVGHVERRRGRHGGAVIGRRPPRHRAGAGARATCRRTPSTT